MYPLFLFKHNLYHLNVFFMIKSANNSNSRKKRKRERGIFSTLPNISVMGTCVGTFPRGAEGTH